jgi:hypothetical protein
MCKNGVSMDEEEPLSIKLIKIVDKNAAILAIT